MKSPLDTAREFHASVQSTGMPPGPGETLGDWLTRSLAPMAGLIVQDRREAAAEAIDKLAAACVRKVGGGRVVDLPCTCGPGVSQVQDRAQAVREALEPLVDACERLAQGSRRARIPQASAAYRRIEGMIRDVADGVAVT